MIIADLIMSPDSPLTDVQRKKLDEEYKNMHTSVKEMEKNLEKANADLQGAKDTLIAEERRFRNGMDEAIGCLHAVKAMLSVECGTHRQRDFYSQAMIRYIDRAVKNIKAEEDPLPF